MTPFFSLKMILGYEEAILIFSYFSAEHKKYHASGPGKQIIQTTKQ